MGVGNRKAGFPCWRGWEALEDEGKDVTRSETWVGVLVELCLVEAVSRGDRPPCRIPDHPQAKGVVRKVMGSMKPSSSGHRFLWKHFLYLVLRFPISQKGGETKNLKCIALWGTKSRNCEPV